MKFITSLVIFFCSLLTQAALDDLVFIQGQIGGVFDKQKVKVIDSNDQIYFLPKSVFPAEFKFEKGKAFSIQLPLEIYKNLEIQVSDDKMKKNK